MTFEEFSPVFAVLTLQLQAMHADEPMARSYFKALADLDVELVQMAAERFAKRGTERGWFPTAPEWRGATVDIEMERQDHQRALLRNRPEPLCNDCGDTGWARVQDGGPVHRCGCQKLRRLEILGRRPWPALPEAS